MKNPFIKNKQPVIEFVSFIDGLEDIEECVPKPYKYYMPDWFKSIPADDDGMLTIKNCPALPDFFSQGYVIPMWSDSIIYYNRENQHENIFSTRDFVVWDNKHDNDQFMKYVDFRNMGIKGDAVFKTNCPWKIITPPGWSVLQLPLFYHFDKRFSVLPGVIDTDIYHQINQQVVYYGDNESITIKRGEPLALYVPFERKKYKHIVRSANDKDKKKINLEMLRIGTRIPGSGEYRKMQRERDKQCPMT
jgi:hypothetical protein